MLYWSGGFFLFKFTSISFLFLSGFSLFGLLSLHLCHKYTRTPQLCDTNVNFYVLCAYLFTILYKRLCVYWFVLCVIDFIETKSLQGIIHLWRPQREGKGVTILQMLVDGFLGGGMHFSEPANVHIYQQKISFFHHISNFLTIIWLLLHEILIFLTDIMTTWLNDHLVRHINSPAGPRKKIAKREP